MKMNKKITFLVLHLGFGGVEKAVTTQANILCQRYEVQILCAYKLYDTPPFPLDERVRVRYLLKDLKPNKEEFSAAVKSKNPFKIIREGVYSLRVLHGRVSAMKKALRSLESDAVISTRILYNRLLVKNCPRSAVKIAQEHRHHNNDEKYIGDLVSSLKGMDYFMPVSKELRDFYGKRLAGTGTKCLFIPNCLDYWPPEPNPLPNKKQLVSVGRLSYEKGFDSLPAILARVLEKFPDARLSLVGDGNQREIIEQKVKELCVDDKITFCGYRDKEFVNRLLSGSGVFLMTSREESFGIVLIEAQSFGLPCVAFSEASGAAEIISDGKNGFLIPDRNEENYAEAVCRLLSDDKLYSELSGQARVNAAQYKFEAVAEQWYDFFAQALGGK